MNNKNPLKEAFALVVISGIFAAIFVFMTR